MRGPGRGARASPRVALGLRARLPPLYPARTRRGVQRSWSAAVGSARGRENGQEACGGVLCALPASPLPPWWPWKVRPGNASCPPSSRLCFHFAHLTPSLPPQEFPSGCPLGDLQATPLPRRAAARLGHGARVHRSQAGGCASPRGWKNPRGAKVRGSDWRPPGTTEPGAAGAPRRAGPEDPDSGLLGGAEALG